MGARSPQTEEKKKGNNSVNGGQGGARKDIGAARPQPGDKKGGGSDPVCNHVFIPGGRDVY